MSKYNDSDSSDEEHISSIPRFDSYNSSNDHSDSQSRSLIPNTMSNSNHFPDIDETIPEDRSTEFQSHLTSELPSFIIDPTSPVVDNDEHRSPFSNHLDAELEHHTEQAEQSEQAGRSEEAGNTHTSGGLLKQDRSNQVNFYDSDSSTEDEVDITDIKDHSNSKESSSSNQNESSSNPEEENFRDKIRRKMSISANRNTDDSVPNDNFLSRILNLSSFTNGGMIPGATKYEAPPKKSDEESNIGIHPQDIEMTNIDFNKEAQGIISNHLPRSQREDLLNNPLPNIDTTNQNVGSSSNPINATTDSLVHQNNAYYRAKQADLDNVALDGRYDDIAPPGNVQAGVLSSLLKLYQNPAAGKSSTTLFTHPDDSDDESSIASVKPISRPESISDFSKWSKLKNFKSKGRDSGMSSDDDGASHLSPKGHRRITSTSSISGLLHKKDTKPDVTMEGLPNFTNAKPIKMPKKKQTHNITPKIIKNKKLAQQARITVHIADILQRQRFILRICKALMLYGAPTHRLEEYMVMTSRVLEIDGQFVYLPGCMIASFGDTATRTSEVNIVRCVQGVNLSKLNDTHKIYKSVVHDLVGVEEASIQLEEMLARKVIYPTWACVLLYGIGSSMVCPFAFEGGWRDVPICFGIGLIVGWLQFYVSSISTLYSSVFEVTASIVVSFIARALGSIHGGKTFCFSAIAQGSLALILPGYIILCGSLELQSRNIVAGSVRMFYAIIYSLFLSFGITLGAALYGWIDGNATNATSCPAGHNMSPKFRIIFIPAYTIVLSLINQANLSQLPVMVIIASAGYVANYFAGLHFKEVTQFSSAIGCFVVGVLGNLYSRLGRGMAVAAMLPAIFVQVPSGIASQASLLSGIATANEITQKNGSDTTSATASTGSNSLSFGGTMVEVAIGISVGLFAATLVVYPVGKKRTGLFTL